ncbi:DUF3817 domain-containing protein [Membranihabitans marinus]|uniref:DUF3817 domain-containing protein n=1 Tax=Membranihabitans marinus TaxID=1227546 RepID=UPI001F440AB2|nr:DUF3817 domain-containing protein [Membranihabitans marinus]
MKYLTNNIGRLRLIGFLEGSSLLILLFIAMPLKYVWDRPLMVEYVGMAHGLLFIAFVVLCLVVAMEYKWSFFKKTLWVLVSSFIPFGTFYIDHKILKSEVVNN